MKSLNNLAILGGTPMFEEALHVGRPNIGNRENLLNRITDILDRNWLTNSGPYVREFEKRIAEFVGVKHAIVMCNGTVALEITIRALEMKGEVIIPSNTFIATAHALQWQEITPVFCDIEPSTYNIDPVKLTKMITPRTTGIIGVHLWGRPCNIDALTKIAEKHSLKLIFDAAHAVGCSYKGRMIGCFGNAEVFSFHATKFINSFEGGAVTTNDNHLAEKIHLMKNFGFAGMDRVIYIGTNGKMSEISAAMGLTSLESIDEFIEVNKRNYNLYLRELSDIPGVKLVEYDGDEKRNYQYIIMEIDKQVIGLTRDQIVQVLHAENILARRYFYPGCHRMEPYRSLFPHAGLMLQNTEKLLGNVICLPTGTSVNVEDIRKICDLLRFIVENGDEIKRRMAKSSISPKSQSYMGL